jgi:hypothetical protein
MFYKTKQYFIVAFCLFFIHTLLYSQTDSIPVRNDQAAKPIKPFSTEIVHNVDIGIGFGLDYGGILGIQVGYLPVKYMTIFGAIGYYIEEVGWELGLKGLLVPKTTKKGFRPFFKFMYGVNS